jgi:hypothetical protein
MAKTQTELNSIYRKKKNIKRLTFDYPIPKINNIKDSDFTYSQVMDAGFKKLKIKE